MQKEQIKEIITEIENNEKLLSFNSKVICYSKLLKSEIKFLFLASLISADNLSSIEDCEKSLEIVNFLKTNIDLIVDNEEEKKEVLKYVDDGLNILNRDLKELNK